MDDFLDILNEDDDFDADWRGDMHRGIEWRGDMHRGIEWRGDMHPELDRDGNVVDLNKSIYDAEFDKQVRALRLDWFSDDDD